MQSVDGSDISPLAGATGWGRCNLAADALLWGVGREEGKVRVGSVSGLPLPGGGDASAECLTRADVARKAG